MDKSKAKARPKPVHKADPGLGYAQVHIDLSKQLQSALIRKQPRQQPSKATTKAESSIYTRVMDRLMTLYADPDTKIAPCALTSDLDSPESPERAFKTYSEQYSAQKQASVSSKSEEKRRKIGGRALSVPKLPSAELLEVPEYVSLYRFSVLDRNQIWQSRKDLKLKVLRERQASSGLEDCTFEPQLLTNRRFNKPLKEHFPVYSARNEKKDLPEPCPVRQLSPYKVRISVTSPAALIAKIKQTKKSVG